MLSLKNIVKDYTAGDTTVKALRGVSIDFREHEFVSILGPSGCGKTTLLNIIGGLDHYTSGDLMISGRSTKTFRDADWDAYRNHSVGFVFQSYNLIPHQTVLSNVELALTLSGVSKTERRRRAKEALERVGLGDQLNKKPNQMSGGQMQRVAIARALVNDPEILLADEPTGALDSETSVQIMEILREVAKDKLIIMVTHNPDLAAEYSSRIIRVIDGQVTNDSDPYVADNDALFAAREETYKKKRPSMSFFTALSLSKNNLMTKRGRTLLTSFAGSIGIIGIALILSVSTGVQSYIDRVQEDTLASYPIMIESETVDMSGLIASMMETDTENQADDAEAEIADEERVYTSPILYDLMNSLNSIETDKNNLSALKEHLENTPAFKEVLSAVRYTYNMDLNIFTKDPDGKVIRCDTEALMRDIMQMPADAQGVTQPMGDMGGSVSAFSTMETWQEMLDGTDGALISDLLTKQYDLLYGTWPTAYNEVVLFVSDTNEVSDLTLYTLGLKSADEVRAIMEAAMKQEQIDTSNLDSWSFEEICQREFKLLLTADLYGKSGTGYTDLSANETGLSFLYGSDKAIPLKIVGIARKSEEAVAAMMQNGIGYTTALTEYVLAQSADTDVVRAQLSDPDTDVLSGLPFPKEDGTELPDGEKAAAVQAYFATLSTAEKAAVYTEIASTPTEEFLNNAATQYLAGVDRAAIEATMIDAYAKEMEIEDIASVEQYIRSMTDEEIFSYASDMIKQQAAAGYAAEVQAQLGAVPSEQIAAMLDALTKTDAEWALLYDTYMPKTVSDATYEDTLKKLGYVTADNPSSIYLYASTFEDKDIIADLISDYNDSVPEPDQIRYTDYVALMMSSITTVINAISYVLIAFVAISLVVSSIMIGIITYISVLERTKEIGILRAIGASKKDISRVFNAETLIVGFSAGAIGIGLTLLMLIPINLILHAVTGIEILSAQLPLGGALILVVISMVLTFVAGLVPSRIAAKKDPVIALRTE